MTSYILAPHFNKHVLDEQKGGKKEKSIITRIYCPELICLWKKKKKQSSKVTNFMRMVGNKSSSVDYRVITITYASGMEKGRVIM